MCYFSNAMNYPQASINVICRALSDPRFDRFEMIVGTGLSGLILLTPISMKSGIPCGAVRKSADFNALDEGGSHSCIKVETNSDNENTIQVFKYVIIDDQIESGKTISRIIEAMEQIYPHSQCAGIVLYQSFSLDEYSDYPVSSVSEDIILEEKVLKSTGGHSPLRLPCREITSLHSLCHRKGGPMKPKSVCAGLRYGIPISIALWSLIWLGITNL